MRKGGTFTTNTVTYFKPCSVVLGWGDNGYYDYVIEKWPVWLRTSRTELIAAELET